MSLTDLILKMEIPLKTSSCFNNELKSLFTSRKIRGHSNRKWAAGWVCICAYLLSHHHGDLLVYEWMPSVFFCHVWVRCAQKSKMRAQPIRWMYFTRVTRPAQCCVSLSNSSFSGYDHTLSPRTAYRFACTQPATSTSPHRETCTQGS